MAWLVQAVVLYTVTAVYVFYLNSHVSDLELARKHSRHPLLHIVGVSAVRNDDVHG